MEIISITKEFQSSNLGRESNVTKICNNIHVKSNDIILDIKECNIDYPATSQLLDTILCFLSKKKGIKSFMIYYDVNFQEIILLQYFVVGSKFLNIDTKFKNIEEYQSALNDKLIQNNIIFTIQIREEEKIIKSYIYGTKHS